MTQSDLPEIVLYMMTEVLIGSIFISTPEGRLLDELNGRVVSAPDNRDKFLVLANVTIRHADGTQEKPSIVYINKSTIQMAGTDSPDTSRGIGAQPNPKPYPFTEKVPVHVRIEMPSYQINGNMYRMSQQKIENVLKERLTFLPLTDVEVIYLANGQRWHVPFLAINKDQILSLYE
jgi:hypothetical protein